MEKADKYLAKLGYAKSARLFDPRQRPKLPRDMAEYTSYLEHTKKGNIEHVRVMPQKISDEEWDYYWKLPPIEGELDLIQFWEGMVPHMPSLAPLALRTLPIPHTGVDVERSFSYYKLCRSSKQQNLSSEHHIGRVSFAMNGVVPPVGK